jgi:hypothetical protein
MAFNVQRGAELVEKAALRGLDQPTVEPNHFDFSFARQSREGIQEGRFADAGNPVEMNYQGSFLRKEIAKVGHFSRPANDALRCSSRKKLAYFGHC